MPSLSDISDVLSIMSDIAIMYKDGRDEAEEATMGTVTTVLPSPKLVDGQGNETPLTDRGYEVVLMVLWALGLLPGTKPTTDVKLSTGEAARVLGTSAKTVGRLIDSGRIRGSRAASGHRYVMLSDLMVYDRECRKAAGAHIERARALADEAGLYGNGYAAELAAYLDGLS